jgi:hypothetical protein
MITLRMLLLDERDVLADQAWFELGKKGSSSKMPA